MFQRLVLHDGHDGSHAKTIVGSEGSALGLHPLAINPWLDGVRLEVMGAFRCLLGHHIHVSLQDHAFLVLHTG